MIMKMSQLATSSMLNFEFGFGFEGCLEFVGWERKFVDGGVEYTKVLMLLDAHMSNAFG